MSGRVTSVACSLIGRRSTRRDGGWEDRLRQITSYQGYALHTLLKMITLPSRPVRFDQRRRLAPEGH